MPYLIILFLAFIFIILVFGILIFFTFLRDTFLVRIPFVPVRKRGLEKIIQTLNMKDGDVLFDLGCGDGRVLLEATKGAPQISGVGVEKGIAPFCISYVKSVQSPIKIKYGEILEVDVSKATHIFCYLSTEMMQKLSHKFLAECKSGTKILSCDFQIPEWKPIETVFLTAGADKLSRTLYLYQI